MFPKIWRWSILAAVVLWLGSFFLIFELRAPEYNPLLEYKYDYELKLAAVRRAPDLYLISGVIAVIGFTGTFFILKHRSRIKSQAMPLDQAALSELLPGKLERNAIVGCCALSLLLFFFPLLTISIPIAGQQDVSGYDVFSKLTEFREKLKPPDATSQTKPYATTPSATPADMPLSIQLGWLMPLALMVAFVSAAVALVTAFKAIHVSRIFCVIGAVCAGAAVLHITIMNSDIHSWLSASMKTMQSDLEGNPFSGLAENMGALMLIAFQIKPGWGVYALLVLLGLAAVLGFSRVLSRLRIAPAGS